MVDAAMKVNDGITRSTSTLLEPVALFFGVWVAAALIWRVQELLFAFTMPRFEASIRMALFRHLEGHSHAFFSGNLSGTIASKLSSLPRAAHGFIDLTRGILLPTLLVVLVAMVLLGTVSIYFSMVLFVWVALHLALTHSAARPATAAANRHAEDEAALNGQILDVLANMSTVRLFSRQNYEQRRIGAYQQVEQDSQQAALLSVLRSRGPADLLLIAMYALMLALIVIGWQREWVSTGDIVHILFTVFNVMSLIWTTGAQGSHIFRAIGECNQSLSLIGSNHQIADAPNARPLIVQRGEIVFDKVCFQYGSRNKVFDNCCITIRGGERVGLVGYSGSGKSTFIKLIVRLFDVDTGRICIDGQDIAQVTQESLRESIAVVPEDTTLFHRSLMENIRYGRPEATDEEVVNASRQACCHEFIAATEEGYQVNAGERGAKLSQGQRQRIAIARGILKRAQILILDEATSSLDSLTETHVQEGLSDLMNNRTTIVIAHRFSTLSRMDRILVFNEGQIVEDGSHESLLASGGHYASLWKSQVGGAVPELTEETVQAS
jgi:ATP-binding cassette subfamily B protein